MQERSKACHKEVTIKLQQRGDVKSLLRGRTIAVPHII